MNDLHDPIYRTFVSTNDCTYFSHCSRWMTFAVANQIENQLGHLLFDLFADAMSQATYRHLRNEIGGMRWK